MFCTWAITLSDVKSEKSKVKRQSNEHDHVGGGYARDLVVQRNPTMVRRVAETSEVRSKSSEIPTATTKGKILKCDHMKD